MRSIKTRVASICLFFAFLLSLPGLVAYAGENELLEGVAFATSSNYITKAEYCNSSGKKASDVTIDMTGPSEWNVTILDSIQSSNYIKNLYLSGDPDKSVTLYSKYSTSDMEPVQILGSESTTMMEFVTNISLSESGSKFANFVNDKLADGTTRLNNLLNKSPSDNQFGPLYYYVVVGTDWKDENKKFDNVDQVIRVTNRRQLTLGDLRVSKDDSGLTLANGFKSNKYNYDVVLPDSDNEVVTLTATPTTNHRRIGVSFSSGGETLSGDKTQGATFKISDLGKNSYGHPYVSVQVYAIGADTADPYTISEDAVPSTYTIQFLDNDVEVPEVSIVGHQARIINTGSSETLEVTVKNKQDGEDDQYTYQWYSRSGDRLKNVSIDQPETWMNQFGNGNYTYEKGSPISGATRPTYQLDTQERPASVYYYWCDVTKKIEGTEYTTHSDPFGVVILSTYANKAVIDRQPTDITVAQNAQNVYFTLHVAPVEYGGKVTVKWYRVETDGSTTEIEAKDHFEGGYGYAFRSDDLPTDEIGTFEYYCVVTNTVTEDNVSPPRTYTAQTESDHVKLTVQYIPGAEKLKGSGTVDDPYQISTIEDLKTVKSIVESGYTLEGTYLKLMNDLTLPADWDPIGALKPGTTSPLNGKNVNPFSGTFDGDKHTLTIEPGGKGIFNYVRKAEIKNLKVYGEKISGSALISGSFTDYGVTGQYDMHANPWRVKIDHVTLVSGSKTSSAGFLFGGGSGINTVWITNSTVEEGCTVGGASFIYDLNGYILNCTSKADVTPAYFGAGGLAGCKGQTMGACNIQNSSFEGTIVSNGYAGGIIGSGYGARGYREGDQSAPNTPVVTVNNCYVHADITGTQMVGGIIGGEPAVLQCWGNGEGTISNNVFVGNIHATDPCDAGGIIGYIRGFDQYQFLHDNYYVADCGVDSGIGYIGTLLYAVESAKPATMPGTNFQLDNKYGFTEQPKFEEYCKAVPRENLNDLVDTLNNATKSFKNWVASDMGPVFGEAVVPYELTIRGDYKTEYVIGDELDLSGAVITATMTDGTTKSVDWQKLTIEGYDKNARGVQKVTLGYGGAFCEITVTVLKPTTNTDADKINVTFTLMGDTPHGKNGSVHTLQKGGLQTWIPRKTYTVGLNATVLDVFEQALRTAGMTWENPSGNYIESITRNGMKLAEMDNGNLSGWMYTLNGHHSDLGVSEQYLDNGDVIIFHYTDDYTLEEGSEQWAGSGPVVKPEAEGPTLEPTVKPDVNGEATAKIEPDTMNDAIADAKQSGAGEIVIAPQVDGEADKVTVELEKSSVDTLSKQTNADLTVKTDAANVTIPQKSLDGIAEGNGSKVSVTVETKDNGHTGIEVAVDGKAISSLKDGLKLDVPAAKDGNVLVIVDASGNETIVKKSIVENGRIEALLDGSCTVKVIDNSKSFTDVTKNNWFADAVAFASSHELFAGTSNTEFSPNSPMTRGMLATALWRLEDGEELASSDTFADVAKDSWYEDGIVWANEHGIVTGYGDNLFGPNDNITREQLAAMLWRYADELGLDITSSGDLNKFADGGNVSAYAVDAVKWAVDNGLLQGKGSGVLDPKGNATRAEVATIMQRMVGMIVK